MGCDGGTIPKRHELVTLKAKEQKLDPRSAIDARWTCCALSKEPLAPPIVSCGLGKLYNKDRVIEFLLDRRVFGDGETVAGHIGGLKDVVELSLTVNPALAEKEEDASALVGNTREVVRKSQYVCPVTLKEMNGKYRFAYSSTCGCVLSEQAIKEVASTQCLKCGKAVGAETVFITINTDQAEELEKLKERVAVLTAERLAAEAARKAARAAAKKEKALEKGTVGTIGDKEKKRKAAPVEDSVAAAERAKRQAADASAAVRANINIPLPKMDLKGAVSAATKSEAIKSLYEKKKDKPQGNFLTMGTFTRYASF